MSKHDNIHETPDVSYIHNEGTAHEHSDVNVAGIAKFTLGLFILTVFTFGLIKVMQWGFEEAARATDPPKNPMTAMTKDANGKEVKDMNAVLPPEPRLQVAPGFRYVRKDGKVIDLSLNAPWSEWHEFQKEYAEIQEKGLKDEKGNYIIKPIEEVEKELLKQGFPTRQQSNAETMEEANKMPSGSSSGRKTEVRHQ